MSDTPETDMFNGCWATERINGETIFGLAQRLERERNKAAECAEALNDIADLLDMPTGATPSDIVGKARSRWATKTKPMKYCDMCSSPSICSELHKCRYAKEQVELPLDAATCSPSSVDCSVCDWQQQEDGQWETDCSETFEYNEGGPKDNGFEWCPYCGKRLTETAYTDPENSVDTPPATTNKTN